MQGQPEISPAPPVIIDVPKGPEAGAPVVALETPVDTGEFTGNMDAATNVDLFTTRASELQGPALDANALMEMFPDTLVDAPPGGADAFPPPDTLADIGLRPARERGNEAGRLTVREAGPSTPLPGADAGGGAETDFDADAWFADMEAQSREPAEIQGQYTPRERQRDASRPAEQAEGSPAAEQFNDDHAARLQELEGTPASQLSITELAERNKLREMKAGTTESKSAEQFSKDEKRFTEVRAKLEKGETVPQEDMDFARQHEQQRKLREPTPEQKITDIEGERKQLAAERAQALLDSADPAKAEAAQKKLEAIKQRQEALDIALYGAEIQQLASQILTEQGGSSRETSQRLQQIQQLEAERMAILVQITETPRKQLKKLQEAKDEARAIREQAAVSYKRAEETYIANPNDKTKQKMIESRAKVQAARGRYIAICGQIVDMSTTGLLKAEARLDQIENKIAILGGEKGVFRFWARSALNMVRGYAAGIGAQAELDREIRARPLQRVRESTRMVA